MLNVCTLSISIPSFIRHSAINFVIFCSLRIQNFNQSWLIPSVLALPTSKTGQKRHIIKMASANKVAPPGRPEGTRKPHKLPPLLKMKLEAKAKASASAVTVTYQQSRLLSSSAAPISTTPLVIHTMPASAKKQLAGIKITPSVCQLALLQHPLVHCLPFSLLTNQPAQQRTAWV